MPIALDVMGGDHGLSVTIPAAFDLLASQQYSHLHFIFVGDQSEITKTLSQAELQSLIIRHHLQGRFTIHHASQKVEMGDAPAIAIRTKKDSSMRVALNLVKEGKAQAMVSAGNTGALVSMAHYVLKMIEGVDRPALVTSVPTLKSASFILDLGANSDSTPENLFQFAVMGAQLAKARGYTNPTIALLNIGTEAAKGNKLVKEAHKFLFENQHDLNYVGFIEPDALFQGDVDVIVCDGFSGNVALKASEGVAKLFKLQMKQLFMKNVFTKIVGALTKKILKPFVGHFDADVQNGASLLGLKGVVVKSHGSANRRGFSAAIEKAILEVEKNVIENIHDQIKHYVKPVPEGEA